MASSALRIRADGTVKAASHDTKGLYGSGVVHVSSTGQDGIPSGKVLIINDTSTDEERVELSRLPRFVADVLNIMRVGYHMESLAGPLAAAQDMDQLVVPLKKLLKTHGVRYGSPIAEGRPEYNKVATFLAKDNQPLLEDLLRAPSNHRWHALIALMLRSTDRRVRSTGKILMGSLMARWSDQRMQLYQLFEGLDPHHDITGFTDYYRLLHDVVRSFCRFEYNIRGDAMYLERLIWRAGWRPAFLSEVRAAFESETDRARAVELLTLMLGQRFESGMAPHKAFKKLKLQQYNRELFDEALLPLLKEYVILYNKFEPKATTTLAKELSLLRRTGEPKKTVVEHAETG